MHVCAPPESSWDPAHELWTPRRRKISIESGSVVVLRPEDAIQIGECTLEFQRDSLKPVGETDDVQVKSSGHTGVIMDTDDEEQQVIKSEKRDLLSNSNQTLSTPDVQPDGSIVKMEAIMETPAASRYQHAAVKTGPVRSRVDESVLRVKDEGQENRGLSSNTRVVSESFDDGTTSVDGSAVQTPRVEDNDILPNGVLADSNRISSDVNTENQEMLSVRLDQTGEDSQMNTAVRVGQPLQTPLDSQEHALNQLPSIPVPAPQIDGDEIPEASDGISVQGAFETKPSDPHPVPELPSKSRKRKQRTEESEVHTTKIDFQIQVPTNEPATAYKTPNKRQKPNPSTISSSSMLDSTRKLTPESPRDSDKPSPLDRSMRSSEVDPATPDASTETGMKIMFARSSTFSQNSKLMSFLKARGVSKVKSVQDCDILCVSAGPLKKTSNLVLAVLRGKEIITDEWARDSHARWHLLDINDYLARDPAREAEWGIDLSQAIARGKTRVVKPLAGHIVYFTTRAKKELGASGFAELKEIALLAGSKAVLLASPQKIKLDIIKHFKKQNSKKEEEGGGGGDSVSVLVIVASQNQNGKDKDKDKERERERERERELSDLPKGQGGFVGCYSKDIITLSALRGVLDTRSEDFAVYMK